MIIHLTERGICTCLQLTHSNRDYNNYAHCILFQGMTWLFSETDNRNKLFGLEHSSGHRVEQLERTGWQKMRGLWEVITSYNEVVWERGQLQFVKDSYNMSRTVFQYLSLRWTSLGSVIKKSLRRIGEGRLIKRDITLWTGDIHGEDS